jgi:hypothetical protein
MNSKSPRKEKIFGQPSWRLENDVVTAFVTETGGHLGPVTFRVGNREIEPFSVAPWVEEKLPPETPNMLRVLRGDFFCMPFGGNDSPFRGRAASAHGEVANEKWTLRSLEHTGTATTLNASLTTKVREGHVGKSITIVEGETALYCRHVVSGMNGSMSFGSSRHAAFSRCARQRADFHQPICAGAGFCEPVEQPEARGYSLLKPGAEFSSLDDVPTITGESADLSRYPARRGFEDIVQLVADESLPFAWTAVTFPKERFVWFAIKNPRVLRQSFSGFPTADATTRRGMAVMST